MRLAAVMLVMTLVTPAMAQAPAPLSARENLMATDRNFSKLSEQRGRAYAFLAMATSNARLFGVGDTPPVYGRAQAFRALTRGGDSRMRWEPQGAGVSGDGRMGWTDGRWEIGARGTVMSGHYLTVWVKDRRGAWKVQANMNTSDPVRK